MFALVLGVFLGTYLALCTMVVACLFSSNGMAEPTQNYLSTYDLHPSVGPSESFSNLLDLLQKNPATHLDEFLVQWKERDPLLFRYYLLAYRSRSLQEASPENPRAIIFHPSTDFAAAFNGHPSQKGFNQIELYRFNYQQNKFEFYELSFLENQKPKLSEANPRKCLDCHQSLGRKDVDPRPNWEPYFMWPGFYGSTGEKNLNSFRELMPNMFSKMDPVNDGIMLEEIPLEKERYDRFLSLRNQSSRYQLLDSFNAEQAASDAKLYGHHAKMELKTLMYTQRVAQINFRRVAKLMNEDKELFSFIKDALFASISCSPGVLPDVFSEWLFENSSLKNNGASLKVLELGDRIKLLFEPFYFDTDDWSMDFKTNAKFAFAHRFGTPGIPTREILKVISEVAGGSKVPTQDCRTMKRSPAMQKYSDLEIVKKIQQRRQSQKIAIESFKNRPLVQRCIGCHVNATSGTPEIPFDNSEKLKNALRKVGFKRGTLFDEIIYRTGAHAESADQMPPRGTPTEQQRKELIEYLKSL